MRMVLIELQPILTEDTFFQEKILTKRRSFYGQRINNQEKNDLNKQYDELEKVSIGEGDEYKAGCLLDFAYLIKSTD